MKRMLLLALMATTMNTMAAESLKTPYGTLSIKGLDNPEDVAAQVLLNGKPIKGLDYPGFIDINNASYKLGNQDIYVISGESAGNGSIAAQEKYYNLLVFESGKKPKVVSHDEFWVNRFQDQKDAVFSVKENKLYGDLGPREGYSYSMVYDGKSVKVKKGKKIKIAKGTMLVDKETCQSYFEDKIDFCDYVRTSQGASSFIQRQVDFLMEKPGANFKSIKNFCKNKKSVKKADYKTFENRVCRS
jgi:hypothetical protein